MSVKFTILCLFTPPLNREQVKNKCRDNTYMEFFVSYQTNVEYVKIKMTTLVVEVAEYTE